LAEVTDVVKRTVDTFRKGFVAKEELSNSVKKSLRNYLYKKTKQSPLIVVSVLEV
jgi:mRNA degradation ribonuclease J1/J2